jgi:tetratricopeptide (TPR) repeat protein
MEKKKRESKKESKRITEKTKTESFGFQFVIFFIVCAALCIIGRTVFGPSLQNRIVLWDNETYFYNDYQGLISGGTFWDRLTTPVCGTYTGIPMEILHHQYNKYGITEVNTGKNFSVVLKQGPPMIDETVDYAPLAAGEEYTSDQINIHILNACILFFFWFTLFKPKGITRYIGAFVVALGFLVRSSHVETVVWLADGKDRWATFFSLCALLVYVLHKEYKVSAWFSKGMLVLHFIFLFCALNSKATAVVVYPICILIDWLLYKEPLQWKLLFARGRWLILSTVVLYGVYAFLAQGSTSALREVHHGVLGYMYFPGYAFLQYVLLWLVPIQSLLCIIHLYPEESVFVYASPLIGLGLLSLFFWKFWRNRAALFCVIAFLISIAPLLQFVPVGKYLWAERYTYFSFIFLDGLIALIVCWCWEKYNSNIHRSIIAGLLAGYFGFLSYQTMERCKVWFNNKTLWSDVAKKYPPEKRYSVPQYEIGASFLHEKGGNLDSARYYFNASNKIEPNVSAYDGLGRVAMCMGNFQEAIDCFTKSIELDTNNLGAYEERVVAYIVCTNKGPGRIDSAASDIAHMLTKDTTDAVVCCIRSAIAYKAVGMLDSTYSLLSKALSFDPINKDAQDEMAKLTINTVSKPSSISGSGTIVDRKTSKVISF